VLGNYRRIGSIVLREIVRNTTQALDEKAEQLEARLHRLVEFTQLLSASFQISFG
jgi:chaperonin cofactor prefoldin